MRWKTRDGGLGHLEVFGDGHEVVERPGEAGHDGGAAADAHLEALLRLAAVAAVAELREEGEVVDVGDHVVVAAAGEGGLPLAGEGLRVLVEDEVAGVGGEVGGDVEGLLQLYAGERVARDVADGVAATPRG